MYDSSIGGTNANSYLDLITAKQIARDIYDPEGDFKEIEDSDLEQLLMQATEELDDLDYLGTITTPTQALKWPRNNSVVIPNLVLKATVLLARHIFKQYQEQQDGNIKRLDISNFKIEYHKATISDSEADKIPDAVLKLLKSYLLDTSKVESSFQFNLIRVG